MREIGARIGSGHRIPGGGLCTDSIFHSPHPLRFGLDSDTMTGMTTPATNDLAANLKARRTAKGLSQYRLAAVSNVSRSAIARIESGHMASLRIVTRLANALDTSPERLLRKRQPPAAA